jgi:hypothetical protein
MMPVRMHLGHPEMAKLQTPAEPEASQLPAPQRGVIAIDKGAI